MYKMDAVYMSSVWIQDAFCPQLQHLSVLGSIAKHILNADLGAMLKKGDRCYIV